MRLDPTYENYVKVLDIFVGKAKGNPLKNYLQIQSFACHGYHRGGFQSVPTPYYDPETKGYKMIDVEKLIRGKVTGVYNAYCLVLFACCREVKEGNKNK